MKTKEQEIKEEIESQRAMLQTYLASNMDIDKMDFNQVVNYAISDVIDQNIFIGHWKDYAFLRGKLEGYENAKQEFIKMIDKLLNKHRGMICCREDCLCWNIDNIKKSLGGKNEKNIL